MGTRSQPIFKQSLALLTWACFSTISYPLPIAAAPASFNQAVGDYNAGKYSAALTEFEAYGAAYPTNALVRYYIALCQQGIGHFDKAKSEFQWVSQNGDARLRSMAQAGMQQLSRAHTQIASASINAASNIGGATQSTSHGGDKVKKVLEFYTDW
jgi:tetratricopeptide (TPR) repeat protein